MVRAWFTALLLAVGVTSTLGASGCALDGDDAASSEDDVKLDTRTRAARRQYDANVAFASSYRPRCTPPSDPARPRVLVTGYGRFMGIQDNASGRAVEALVPGARYPWTMPVPEGTVDPPGSQLSVATTTMTFAGVGPVEVCAMILPVYWDLAAILVARELDAFAPTFVMMNGVADTEQPLWLELGSMNRATALDDSAALRPSVRDADLAPILSSVPPSEYARPNLLSWTRVRDAAVQAIDARYAVGAPGGRPFGDVVQGAVFAGFPRVSNTYLCNDITYVTSYLMDHPRESVKLMEASVRSSRAPNDVKVALQRDFRSVPRVFVHWPSELAPEHRGAAGDVMRAMIEAQLGAWGAGDAPTRGDTRNADPSLAGGATY